MPHIERVQFRPAISEDIPALCRLLEALFSIEADFAPDPAKQAQALAMLIARSEAVPPASCLVWVAELDRRVIGMCSIQVCISTAEGGEVGLVEDVIVDAGFRRQGIGHAMLHSLEAWARGRGLSRLHLLADKHNHPALAFYQQNGWDATRLLALRKHLPT